MPHNGDIRGFFKPFTIPKNKRPDSSVLYDEIVVAPARSSPETPAAIPNVRGAAALQRGSLSPLGKRKRHAEEIIGTEEAARPRSPGFNTPDQDGSTIPSSLTELSSEKAGSVVDHGVGSQRNIHQGFPLPTPDTVRRTARSVEIPSPRSSHGTPQPTSPSEQLPPLSASFGAVSSTSHSSSRRVKKNGLHAVTNSDSDSLEASEDDLADVSTFVRKKRKATPPAAQNEQEESHSTVERSSKRRSARLSRSTDNLPRRRPSPLPPMTSTRSGLKSLLAEKERQQCSEAWIAETEAEMEQELKQALHSSHSKGIDSRKAAAAMADNSDEEERLAAALDRIEALQPEEKFYFFRNVSSEVENKPFPVDRLPKTRWAQQLRQAKSRTQSCLTGFVADVAMHEPPPLEVLEWMANQTVLDHRQDLCEAYVGVLHAATQHPHCKLESLATLRAFYDIRPIDVPESRSDLDGSQSLQEMDLKRRTELVPQGLEYVVQIVSICAATAPFSVQSRVLGELVLLNNDANVKKRLRLQRIVQEAFTTLLECVDSSQLGDLQERLTANVIDLDALSPDVTLQVIAAMPADTLRTHSLRRALSLNFFSELLPPCSSAKSPSSPQWTDRILDHLRSNFVLDEQTNYSQLSHLTAVLDIAIDAGFSDFAFLNHKPRATTKTAPAFTLLAVQRKSLQTADEIEFNKSVDKLAKNLRLLANQIQTSGASHFHRTEARSAMERLVLRLSQTVRTRPKAVKGIFAGTSLNGIEDQLLSLDRFVRKGDNIVNESEAKHEVDMDHERDAEKTESFFEAAEYPST